jgi:hypothetical protein
MTHVNARCGLPGIASVREAACAMRDPDIGSTTLADICNRVLSTVASAASVEPAMRLMAEKTICHLPVVIGEPTCRHCVVWGSGGRARPGLGMRRNQRCLSPNASPGIYVQIG